MYSLYHVDYIFTPYTCHVTVFLCTGMFHAMKLHACNIFVLHVISHMFSTSGLADLISRKYALLLSGVVFSIGSALLFLAFNIM